MIEPSLPTPPAPYSSTPTEPALKPIPEGSGPKPAAMPSPATKTGHAGNFPKPCDYSPQGNALGAFPKTARSF